ncbi:hypothetical protein LW139_08680 [Proteus vulgaris]|uniref:hypothetical protein n=1 Tax=Proteus vulgaris TaxID=585 RepID=UPI0020003B7E|nr:hypothetical protein [Proteus vulgaris]UPK82745.1 hypothetical protein LW139_08680 [Proteus vulgaris]
MHYPLFLLFSIFIIAGCSSSKVAQAKFSDIHIDNPEVDNSRIDSNTVNNNLVFMLGKQSRFELEVQEDNRKFGQLFKVGLNEPKSSVNNQYINNEYSTMKPIQKISFTMPVPEPIWNEKKQTVEFKWIQKPHYTFDAY